MMQSKPNVARKPAPSLFAKPDSAITVAAALCLIFSTIGCATMTSDSSAADVATAPTVDPGIDPTIYLPEQSSISLFLDFDVFPQAKQLIVSGIGGPTGTAAPPQTGAETGNETPLGEPKPSKTGIIPDSNQDVLERTLDATDALYLAVGSGTTGTSASEGAATAGNVAGFTALLSGNYQIGILKLGAFFSRELRRMSGRPPVYRIDGSDLEVAFLSRELILTGTGSLSVSGVGTGNAKPAGERPTGRESSGKGETTGVIRRQDEGSRGGFSPSLKPDDDALFAGVLVVDESAIIRALLEKRDVPDPLLRTFSAQNVRIELWKHPEYERFSAETRIQCESNVQARFVEVLARFIVAGLEQQADRDRSTGADTGSAESTDASVTRDQRIVTVRGLFVDVSSLSDFVRTEVRDW